MYSDSYGVSSPKDNVFDKKKLERESDKMSGGKRAMFG